MPYRLPARVKQTTTSTGTGALTLIAPGSNLRTFAAVFGASPRRVSYVIQGATYFEVGIGTFNGSNSLTRDAVLASSNGGAAVSLPVGTHDVFAAPFKGNAIRAVASGNVTLTLADLGEMIVWRGGTAGTINAPDIATVPDFVEFEILNLGTANLTFDPSGSQEVNDATTLVLRPGEGAVISGDPSSEWYARRTALALGAILGANAFTAAQSVTVTSGDALTLTSTDAGAGDGPLLPLFRNAATTGLGGIIFDGLSSTSVRRTAARIRAKFLSRLNAAESAVTEFFAIIAGAETLGLTLGSGVTLGAATGGDPGAGAINATNYERNGVNLPNQRRYVGAWQSLAAAGLVEQTHGLGAAPNPETWFALLRNNSGVAIENWPNLEEFLLMPHFSTGASGYGFQFLGDDALKLKLRVGASGILAMNKTTGVVFIPSLGSWQIALGCYI